MVNYAEIANDDNLMMAIDYIEFNGHLDDDMDDFIQSVRPVLDNPAVKSFSVPVGTVVYDRLMDSILRTQEI